MSCKKDLIFRGILKYLLIEKKKEIQIYQIRVSNINLKIERRWIHNSDISIFICLFFLPKFFYFLEGIASLTRC